MGDLIDDWIWSSFCEHFVLQDIHCLNTKINVGTYWYAYCFFKAKLVNAINKHSHQNEKGDLSARQITHTPAAD